MNTSRAPKPPAFTAVDHLLARLLLGVGRDRVLEIEDDAVGRQACAPSRWRGRSSPACRARCGADGWSWVASQIRYSVAASQELCQRVRQCDAPTQNAWLAGVDGCAGGWIVAFVRPDGGEARLRIVPRFADVLAAPERPAIVAVDMPIGLPERVGTGGRAAENAVRPLLGARQSSVFSVPSRAAIYAADYREACRIALATSEPPRKVSKQLFNIAPKIREVDEALRADADAPARVFEVHPELAFWRLNGERALTEPKKVKSRPYEPGLALRREPADRRRPAGRRGRTPRRPRARPPTICSTRWPAPRSRGGSTPDRAQPFPDPPPRDAFGLRDGDLGMTFARTLEP